MIQVGKNFFFEKKKQKTFVNWGILRVKCQLSPWAGGLNRHEPRPARRTKSFLPLFFKKEVLASLI
jgi:hypothetical protein